MIRIFILLLAIWPFSLGKPVADAVVAVENRQGTNTLVWQQTGDKGKVSLRHLDSGSYRLVVSFPDLDGKWIRNRERHYSGTKATWNPKTKTYYYQGEEGCFSLKLSGIRKIGNDDFKAMFKELRGEEDQGYVVAEFNALRSGAGLSVQVKKLTPRQFKRITEKTGNDISSYSMPGMY